MSARDRAVETAQHYFLKAHENHVVWTSDSLVEVEGLVDDLIQAAVDKLGEELQLKLEDPPHLMEEEESRPQQAQKLMLEIHEAFAQLRPEGEGLVQDLTIPLLREFYLDALNMVRSAEAELQRRRELS